MPTAGTAGVALEKTMKLCFSGQLSNSDKEGKKVTRHVYSQFDFDFKKKESVLSAWLCCLFSTVMKSHYCAYYVQVLFYLMLSISKGRLALLHTVQDSDFF